MMLPAVAPEFELCFGPLLMLVREKSLQGFQRAVTA